MDISRWLPGLEEEVPPVPGYAQRCDGDIAESPESSCVNDLQPNLPLAHTAG